MLMLNGRAAESITGHKGIVSETYWMDTQSTSFLFSYFFPCLVPLASEFRQPSNG